MAIFNSYVKLPEGISPLFQLVLGGQKCGAPSDVNGIGRRAQQPGSLVMVCWQFFTWATGTYPTNIWLLSFAIDNMWILYVIEYFNMLFKQLSYFAILIFHVVKPHVSYVVIHVVIVAYRSVGDIYITDLPFWSTQWDFGVISQHDG